MLGTRTTKSNGEDEKSSGDMPWLQELTAGGSISVSVVGERKGSINRLDIFMYRPRSEGMWSNHQVMDPEVTAYMRETFHAPAHQNLYCLCRPCYTYPTHGRDPKVAIERLWKMCFGFFGLTETWFSQAFHGELIPRTRRGGKPRRRRGPPSFGPVIGSTSGGLMWVAESTDRCGRQDKN